MIDIREQFFKRNRYVQNEPQSLGNDLYYVEYREGKTGKVPRHVVVKPSVNGSSWTVVGRVRTLYGYQNGLFEGYVWSHPWSITGKFRKHEDAVTFMIDIAQRYMK